MKKRRQQIIYDHLKIEGFVTIITQNHFHMYFASPYSQTVQYCKNIWNILEATSVLTLPMRAEIVKWLMGILKVRN